MENQFDEIMEYFEDEIFEDHFENYRKNITTTIAYLIGVTDEKFTGDDRFDINEYEKLKNNDDATIIRYLSKLRTQFLKMKRQEMRILPATCFRL